MKSHSTAPEALTLVDLLRSRAAFQPERSAYTFLINGEEEESSLTHAELDRQARVVGAALQAAGATGERALLLYQPSLEYIAAFYGCLYAAAVAVPAYPPRPNQSFARLQSILHDAQATVVLTTTSIHTNLKRRFGESLDFTALRWVTTDSLDAGLEFEWEPPPLEGTALAFLQYTSGSTSSPKGVMLSHRNLLHNLEAIRRCFGHTPESRGLIWLPPYHDMGLIGGILEPIYAGFPVTLMSPYAFLQRPSRWLQAISRVRATTSGGPNFAYELCLQRIRPEEIEAVDLSSWEVAFNGAEPIRPQTLERFAEKFAANGFRRQAFYPCYGLAEATLIVTGGSKEDLPVVRTFSGKFFKRSGADGSVLPDAPIMLVGCGRVIKDQKLVIADPAAMAELPQGEVGEIWVAGPSVSTGYWNNPRETALTFGATLADGRGPFMRTGDLGFLCGGELFVTGRLKDLIMIRGRNYYPQDIELTVEKCHPAFRPGCGAAFTVDAEGDEQLVVVQEVERQALRDLDLEAVCTVVRESVAEHHELRVSAVRLVKPGSILKTSSGKVRRLACRDSFLNETLEVVGAWTQKRNRGERPDAPPSHGRRVKGAAAATQDTGIPSASDIQNWLTTKIAERLKVQPAEIDVSRPFTSYGLDSLAAATLSAETEQWLGRTLPTGLLWEYPSVETLSRHLAGEFSRRESEQIKPADYRVELFPEYVALKQLMHAVGAAGGNPYFKVNDRITRTTTRIEGRECINFSAYNYLGMSGDPIVSAAAKRAIDTYGTSVSASRVASGERPLHRELEAELARLIGTEDCVVFIGGHTANVTAISTLFRPGDLILYDAYSHNSLLQGCLLSGARSLPFRHNDWQEVNETLLEQRRRFRRVLIVIEGIYSMDGDIPDLPRFIEIKQRHNALLMIDEAHSIGVLGPRGRGISEYFGIDPADVDLWMGTLSKSFASCGGYIAGARAVVEYLKYSGSGFVYSVGISPPNAAAALAAIRLLDAEPERVARLHERADLFLRLAQEHGLNKGTSRDSPVIPIIIGDSFRCIRLSHRLLELGINVQPIIAPAVEEGAARLRFFINSTHTEEQIRRTVSALVEEIKKDPV